MAARRGKNQARRSGRSGGTPGWVWLIAGLVIGALAFGWWQYRDRLPALDGGSLPKPDPEARARGRASDADEVAPVPEKPRPRYDFYTLLPEKEVVIPDAELDAQAEAEAAARARAAAQAAAAAAAAETTGVPGDAAEVPATASAAPASTPARGERYLIQAGAFRGQAEAEALKARIALTGEIARVETATINGTTVHRVRMGPYPDASGLAAAKQALASHGISAQAIKVK